jgi:hypothetical protein
MYCTVVLTLPLGRLDKSAQACLNVDGAVPETVPEYFMFRVD